MARISQNSLVTIYFELYWKSAFASHVERYLTSKVSFTRDILPLGVKSRMRGLGPGDSVEMMLDPSEIPAFKPGAVLDMPQSRFTAPFLHGRKVKPRIGRFYPQRLISNVPGSNPKSTAPFRVVKTDKAGFKADLNHPMAGREVRLKATVIAVHGSDEDTKTMTRWPDKLFKGPGMQVRLTDTPTDFLGSEPFMRNDEAGDAKFYAAPRMLMHLDKQAANLVQKRYAELLTPGMDVLDLMAGHASHLPEDIPLHSVVGLGLNREEMEANTALTENVVFNLNEEPRLPFEDNSFDMVICTSSVEYLTKPFEVFEDVARVLRPGGVFAITFSNRWFEPKVIRIWSELHEFERMGLVSQYLFRTELFTDIHTATERGWPRLPDDTDRYEGVLPKSDPIFMVWGRKVE